ncbi:hypothetical protein EV383_3454 [Pseudonocardia sediminis]|uniref:Uncharacterized protein n=1 Tax=Pseudonocardia sediminis TaxID=1397368 RepID=A0A4Q7UWY6_PSEST|nr:hypothetical protein EV383_3454 [Pseudonocardia sediminis]
MALAVLLSSIRGGPLSPRPWEKDLGNPDAAGTPAQFRPDRGIEPMTVTLRQMDACALLARAMGDAVGPVRGDLVATAPHTCATSAGRIWTEVSVGALITDGEKWRARPVVAGGVRAYLQAEDPDGRYMPAGCDAFVPVTFRMGLRLVVSSPPGSDPCSTVTRLVEKAVPHLRDGSDLTIRIGSRAPLGAGDACMLLAAVVPEAPTRWPGTEPRMGHRTSTVDGCTALVAPEHEIALAAEYDDLPGGAGVHASDSGCIVTVPLPQPDEHSDPGVEVTGRSQITLTDTAPDCATARRAGDRLPSALSTVPNPDPAARPVRLFAPDEPDVDPVGACADAPVPECRIPRQVTLPGQPRNILAASHANTAYTCALAQHAVHRWFGPQMQPAIYGDFCHFVDASHEVDVMVSATDRYRLGPDSEPAPRPTGRSGPIDGHEVHYTESGISGYGQDHEWTVAAGTGPTGSGVITVDVILNPARGVDPGLGSHPPVNRSVLPRGEQVVTDILREHFAE